MSTHKFLSHKTAPKLPDKSAPKLPALSLPALSHKSAQAPSSLCPQALSHKSAPSSLSQSSALHSSLSLEKEKFICSPEVSCQVSKGLRSSQSKSLAEALKLMKHALDLCKKVGDLRGLRWKQPQFIRISIYSAHPRIFQASSLSDSLLSLCLCFDVSLEFSFVSYGRFGWSLILPLQALPQHWKTHAWFSK